MVNGGVVWLTAASMVWRTETKTAEAAQLIRPRGFHGYILGPDDTMNTLENLQALNGFPPDNN
jgi:hypothetical protein